MFNGHHHPFAHTQSAKANIPTHANKDTVVGNARATRAEQLGARAH